MKTIDHEKLRTAVLKKCISNGYVSENTLAREFQVSRTPIRQILHQLEKEDLIERTYQSGIRLRRFSIPEACQIYDIRASLESLACRFLAANVTPAVLAEIKRASDDYDDLFKAAGKGLQEKMERIEKDTVFHRTIVLNCGSKYLINQIENLHIILNSMNLDIAEGVFDYIPVLKYPHLRIIKAFEAGDPQQAEGMMRLHIEEAKVYYLRLAMSQHVEIEANGAWHPNHSVKQPGKAGAYASRKSLIPKGGGISPQYDE